MTRKNILITGASSGLGHGMALEFGKMGRNLGLCARRTDRLEALRDELRRINPDIKVAVHELDVNDTDRVFEVFRTIRDELGGLDRVIVNAGMGKGASLGTGYARANLQTATTNFVAAIAQCEAALEIFREQNHGHLVTISSMSAFRGLPRAQNVYSATKAGLAALSEGLRVDLLGTPIRVTTVYPGYIRSEINEKVRNTPFMVDTETGCKMLVRAIEREPDEAIVPRWPWAALRWLMPVLPRSAVNRMN
ncbi:MAG: SDR family oxidoreductase [Candidatus Dadabacteria bacterium]|nr:MAG: SDR family oxidoreductase [Candidatus Dadabacteria bacterium]